MSVMKESRMATYKDLFCFPEVFVTNMFYEFHSFTVLCQHQQLTFVFEKTWLSVIIVQVHFMFPDTHLPLK